MENKPDRFGGHCEYVATEVSRLDNISWRNYIIPENSFVRGLEMTRSLEVIDYGKRAVAGD